MGVKRQANYKLKCEVCFEELLRISDYFVGLIEVECFSCGTLNYYTSFDTLSLDRESIEKDNNLN